MADQPTSSQSNGISYPKTFTPYTQPAKTFQPYVPPSLVHSANLNPSKNSETKNELNKYNYSPTLVSSSSAKETGITSPKFQTAQFKTVPSFLEGRNPMKSSMISTEQQAVHFKQQSKLQPNGYVSPLQNTKKIPRMSDHPDMKLSSIELGSQGYKVPSFLNKQKKIPYMSGSERPQSSKQLLNPKDSVSTQGSLNSSYGNLRKNKGDENKILEIKDIKDPTQQWTKKSWNKKKQKMFTINDFEQIKQLGAGKYGKVYLAKEKQTNFICALKILEKALIKEQEITEQLIRELKIQTFLNHTNITKMYGFFDDAVNIYLIMQAATGGQLFKQLKKHQSMPQVKVASIMRQVCQAIAELHSNRIIHRDIKPENIVLHDNVIKLCDFGWSVYCDSNLRTTFCGTPLYVAPDILKGKQYDQKIDIWSLGVMMYEMLVGENPFKITKQEELIKIIKDDIVIPNYVQITPEAKSFLFACLQKNPNDRLSIRELLSHDFFKKYPQKNDKKLGL